MEVEGMGVEVEVPSRLFLEFEAALRIVVKQGRGKSASNRTETGGE
jgi:hypothetical protein